MMKRRIYADTSVIGGCVDAEFEKASQLLMETFRRSEATLVISSLTLLELASAPAAVQAALSRVPEADREYVELTEDAVVLANLYIDAGAIGAKNRADAQHMERCRCHGQPSRSVGELELQTHRQFAKDTGI